MSKVFICKFCSQESKVSGKTSFILQLSKDGGSVEWHLMFCDVKCHKNYNEQNAILAKATVSVIKS